MNRKKMQTIVKNTKSTKTTDWSLKPTIEVQKEKIYSDDEIVDAFFKGRQEQFEEDKKILLDTFSSNLAQAKKVCEEFFDTLWNSNIRCKFVLLRALTITHFDAVFVVPKEKFLSPDFISIYKMARNKKTAVNTTTFQFFFSFMPLTDTLNEERMLNEGYIMRYGKAA